MSRPIPPEDARAIERALDGRNRSLKSLRKLWFGGPWTYSGSRMPIPYQTGRPYLATCVRETGQIANVRLVIDGTDVRGDPIVKERLTEGWETISKLGPAVKTLVL